jgi:hypothetical protein
VNQFTYTADFGQGITASFSAQDQVAYMQAGNVNLGVPGTVLGGSAATAAGILGGAYGLNNTGGSRSPDLIAMLRVDQAWGLFQASFAAHDNHVAYYGSNALGSSELLGHPDDRWGWAAQLALSIKNIPTGPGDTINVQGVYTSGATRYNIQDLGAAAGANQIYGGTSLVGAYQSVGLGVAPDTVFGTGTQQQLVQTWGMRGAFTHNWNPFWNTALYGAFAAVSYNDNAKTLLCGTAGIGLRTAAAGAVLTNCNPDYNIGQLGLITRWTPVKNLTFSADFTYSHLDQKMEGTILAPSAAIGKPAAVYELRDQNTYQALLRAQRTW